MKDFIVLIGFLVIAFVIVAVLMGFKGKMTEMGTTASGQLDSIKDQLAGATT